MSSSTWSRRMRSRSPTTCTSVWRLPRCQASRTKPSGVARGDLQQRLGLPRDQHHRAVIEHDAVAVAQRDRLVEVQHEIGAALAFEHDPAAMPVAGIEHDAVERGRGIPEPRAPDGEAALHIGLAAGTPHNGRMSQSENMSKPSILRPR